MKDQDTIPVIDEYSAREDAYEMGQERFGGSSPPEDIHPLEVVDHFTETATWANHVHPKLRAMAGFKDRGMGTYTVARQVALIPPENADDEPAEAELVDSTWLVNELVDEFREGAFEGLDG